MEWMDDLMHQMYDTYCSSVAQSIGDQTPPSTDSSIYSSKSSRSSKSENVFFANIQPDVNMEHFEEPEPMTPTTIQRNLCLDATSDINTNLTDDEDGQELERTVVQRAQGNLCLCAASKPREIQKTALRIPKTNLAFLQHPNFPCKKTPITDEYRITHEIIGIGESGKVMACFGKHNNTKYALKVLRDGPKSRREVHLHYLTSHHENIVTIVDIFENTFDGVRCLLVVIEFLEAGDLLTQFENQQSRPYPEEKVAEIVRQIGSAVQFLHSLNIAHRDIKLENILCSSTEHEKCIYKLADFGFAKRPERNNLMESPCCTPLYVAPEVLSNELYDKSCDQWSLGVAIYILLCGYPPFYSLKGLPLSPGMRTRITSGLYAFPPAEWNFVSEETKSVIRNLLKTDPTRRMTINQLMESPFVKGQSSPASSDSGCGLELDEPTTPEPETPEGFLAELNVPRDVRKAAAKIATHAVSARQMPRTVHAKAPRLHSIQEEVNRCMNHMRLQDTAAGMKPLKLSGNSLYERRCRRNSFKKLKSPKETEPETTELEE